MRSRTRTPRIRGPLRRLTVPRDLVPLISRADTEVDPASVGMDAVGVERIWSGVEHLYRTGVYPAITVCVRRHGAVVLDRAIGWAQLGTAPIAATPQTPFCIFSSSKAITATVVHALDERGVLHVGDKVADYLPEFRRTRAEDITLDHVLSHRAGIPQLPRDAIDLDRLDDLQFMSDVMSQLRPRGRAGAALAYHAVSGGFVLGEVVRRATGKDIREVLAQEILDPLSFRWTNYGVAAPDIPAVGLGYNTGPPLLPPASTALARALGLPADEVTEVSNDPRFLTGIVPAGNVVTTAHELSRFMDLLRAGGTLDGLRVLSPRTIRRAVAERSYHEFDRTLGVPLRHGSGYMLGAKLVSLYGPDTDEAFGHLGFTNVMAWADPRRELSVGLITSGKPTVGPHLPALWQLTRRIGQAAPKVAEPELYRG